MTRLRIQVGCEFVYEAAVETPAVFLVKPHDDPAVGIVREQWTTDPIIALRSYSDLYGNDCVRGILPAGRSAFAYAATLEVADAVEPHDVDAPELAPDALPDDVILYTLPSRYCLPDKLGGHAWGQFGQLSPGYRRVQAICDYVNGHLQFQYGSSGPDTTAEDVFNSGCGVCRDFTHLAISFCRALNIPARYVFGYLPEIDIEKAAAPMDFAAWMEVWLGDRWWTFDPRNNVRRKGRAVIGRGRDASDVAMATTFGNPYLVSMTVRAGE